MMYYYNFFFVVYSMSTIYRPKKRKYPQNDPFFEEGNVALRAFWLRKEATSQAEIEMITEQTDNVSR